jgi:hypothetical protein
MTDPSGWIALVFTTLGAGVIGSIITTYGSQGRVRRKARSQALSVLQRIETARLGRTVGEGLAYDRKEFAALEASCMVAGVPSQPVSWLTALSEASAGPPSDPGPIIATAYLIGYSSFLVQQSLWHPYLSRIFLYFRIWRLRRIVSRCSTLRNMDWLLQVDARHGVAQLGHVQRRAKEL